MRCKSTQIFIPKTIVICDTSTISVNVGVLLKEIILELVLNILTHHLVLITCLVPDTPNQSLFQISKVQNVSRAQNNIIHTTEVISIFKHTPGESE